MTNTTIASQFSGLPMKALIGAPLKAAIDANAMIAQSQTQFILNNCFEKPSEDSHNIRPVMVQFQLERNILHADGQPSSEKARMDFSIPLMSMMPISSLAIETLKIEFQVEIKSSREFTRETSSDRKRRSSDKGLDNTYKAHEFDTELHGTLATRSNDKTHESTGTNYEVTLTAGQLPLPGGITSILDIFTKNLSPIPSKQTGN